MAVQLSKSKQTVIIDTANIDNWGLISLLVVLQSLYLFQIEGVYVTDAPNELITISSDGSFHVNTFSNTNTQLFKFSDENISFTSSSTCTIGPL